MPLSSGTRIGSFEIIAVLGAGGMGEVYRARDAKLGRDVALKTLPEGFASDPERVVRLRREAQLLASLNHPHIATIFGLEEIDASQFLVMELVEGGTLAASLATDAAKQQGLPVSEALKIAIEIADALESAHERGIIHRNLKPANIGFTTDGQVKVLDFGLARALDAAPSAELSISPTLSIAATRAGVILGTAAYMSPEQAKGRVADKRSDVWSFGCVLYEMLTGRQAFDGEDLTETIAAVVRAEPDWTAFPPEVPAHIRDLVKQCLQKDRRQRISDIAVARYVISQPAIAAADTTPAASEPTPPPRQTKRIAAVAAASAAAAAVIVAAGAWILMRPPVVAPPPVMRFAIVPPAAQPFAVMGADRDLAISPDGTHIVYRAAASVGGRNQTQLVVRGLNELEGRPLAGTDNPRAPFISPDGHWVGFFGGADSRLKKVSMTGGPTIALSSFAGAPRGASWITDDTIVFATNDPSTGLLSVPAGGGEPKVLTKPDTAHGEQDHVFPSVLPGGRAVLFTIVGAQPESAQVEVLDLTTGQRKTVVRGGSSGVFVPPRNGEGHIGYLVYAAAGSLRAVRFDAERLQPVGDPVPALDQLATLPTGAAEFAVSGTGSLVFVPGAVGGVAVEQPRSLVWVSRQGREDPIKAAPHDYTTARLSPDGTRVALSFGGGGGDVWIWDLTRQNLSRMTTDPTADQSPIWTPDGRIIWASNAGGPTPNIFRQAADGTGIPERLTTSSGAQFPTSISADGAHLLLFETPTGGTTNFDVSTLTLEPSSKAPLHAEPIIHTAALESNPDLSPDGRWLAYQSNESGRDEIYVRPYPRIDEARVLISVAGGTRPAWARSGRELFYLDAGGFLTSVPVPVQAAGSAFKAGTPTKLLSTRYYAGATRRGDDLRGYDVSADGQRFLMIKENLAGDQASEAPAVSMVVVLNWLEELKARVGK